MIIVLSIAIGINILISIMNSLTLRNISLALSDQKSLLKDETVKTDPFLEDVMHYAFERGVKPISMPNQEGKNTLFDSDKSGAYAICELFTTTHKQGTKGYNELFQRLKDQIDHYCENKILIKEKAREQREEQKPEEAEVKE
jgi:hypothetical protein